jgi:MYXO-CTERM domain-containing protein
VLCIAGAAGLAGSAWAQTGTATYSIAFGSPAGPSTIQLGHNQSVDVFVNVAWTTGGTPTPIGLSDGAFGLTGGGGAWAVDSNTASATYSLPNPWGAQGAGHLGVSVGSPSATGVSGVNWGYGFLLTPTHPFPQNPANVWRGTYTAGTVNGQFGVTITPNGTTGVFAQNVTIPTVLNFQSNGGPGGTITIVPGPASLALLGLGTLAATRRRR